MMKNLTSSNYHSLDANKTYWSVSQFKQFDKCEACGLASARGQYHREETDALLIGGYVDAYFAGEMDEFVGKHSDTMFKKNGELYAKFEQANQLINTIECQPLMYDYLAGQHQVIRTGNLFGVDWKVKIDSLHEKPYGNVLQPCIVDLKVVKDFEPIYKEGFGRMDWVSYWGYDIQGAIYQKIEQISSQRAEPLPFYIVAVTKEKTPDIAVIRLPQHVLDTALKIVESKIDRFDLVKTGEIEPERCEKCEWCKSTKILTEPRVYEVE